MYHWEKISTKRKAVEPILLQKICDSGCCFRPYYEEAAQLEKRKAIEEENLSK